MSIMFKLFLIEIEYQNRVLGLDIVRAIAILSVVFYHGNFIIAKYFPGFPYLPIFDGVELFFVLSGFLIGTILISIFEKEKEFNFSIILKFWKRRWLRTIPNYYLVILINIFTLFIISKIQSGTSFIKFFSSFFKNTPLINYFTFTQNLYSPHPWFFSSAWSLSVEEWFYLLLPLVLLILSYLLNNKLTKKQIIFFCILGFILYFNCLRMIKAINIETENTIWWDMYFRKIVFMRLDAVMYGVLGAYTKYYYNNFWFKYKNHFFCLGIFLIYFSLYFIEASDTTPIGFYQKVFHFSVTGVGMLFLLPKADSIKSGKVFFVKIVSYISIISYSMYLLHLLYIDTFRKLFLSSEFIPNMFLYFTYWFLTISTSILLYKFFEKPVTDLRDKSGYHKLDGKNIISK